MILTGSAIKEYVVAGLIKVKPRFDEKQLRPFGLRVHLAGEIMRPRPGTKVNLSRRSRKERLFDRENIKERPLMLRPGEFILGACIESLRMDCHIMGVLDGRSTVARLGITIHSSSNSLDGNSAEFRSIVLNIKNTGPFDVTMPYGYPIGMIIFHVTNVPSNTELIQSQYKGQRGVTEPNLNFHPPIFKRNKKR